jgi:hypothetical protein
MKNRRFRRSRAALAADPSGWSRPLGRELDLVVGYDDVTGLEVKGGWVPGVAELAV